MRDKIIVDKMLRYANKVCEYCKGVSYEDFRTNDMCSLRLACSISVKSGNLPRS